MNRLKSQQGLTLIETVITLAILSFGLISLMKLQGDVSSHSLVAKQQALAASLAQTKIEDLRGFSQINSGDGIKAYDDIKNGSQTMTKANTQYQLDWNVINNTTPDHKVVYITITWSDKNAVSHSVKLSSIISKIDPASSGSVLGSTNAGSLQPPN